MRNGVNDLGGRGNRQPKLAVAKPLYLQVRNLMVDRILRGEWGMRSEPLPNEFKLSEEFGVSMGTIRRAIETLENTGMLVRKQGRGTFVEQTSNIESDRFLAWRRPDGERPIFGRQLQSKRRDRVGQERALEFGMLSQADVLVVEQLLLCDDLVVGHECTVLEWERFPNFIRQLHYGQDLGAILVEYGVIATAVIDRLSIATPEPSIADALGVSLGAPLFRLLRVARDVDDAIVERSITWMRLDKFSYLAELSRGRRA